MSWSMALYGALGAGLLIALVGRAGGLRWWRRRGALAQIALMILLPIIVMALGLLGFWFLSDRGLDNLPKAAGLLFGLGMATFGPLAATSYLVDQIRIAFGPSDDDQAP